MSLALPITRSTNEYAIGMASEKKKRRHRKSHRNVIGK